MRTGLSSFLALWQRLQAKGDATMVHEQLVAAYGEPHRAYHSMQHLEECLLLLDQVPPDAMASADAIEMALWLHDAVYDPQAADNEEQSAALARSVLSNAGVAERLMADIERLILVTKTHLANPGNDSAWMVDIDLAILGQPERRFQEYERQIKHEYAWVPAAVYREKRAEVLQRFQDRRPLFLTTWFRDHFEWLAHENLAHALRRLQGPFL